MSFKKWPICRRGHNMPRKDRQAICPVTVLVGYLAIRRIETSPPFCFQEGSSLSKQKLVAHVWQVLATWGGMDSSQVTGQFSNKCSISGVPGWPGRLPNSNFGPLALIRIPKICTHTRPNVGSRISSVPLLLSLWTTAHLQLRVYQPLLYQQTLMNRLSPVIKRTLSSSVWSMYIIYVYVPFWPTC